MPCVCEYICQQCLFCTCSHATLALRVRGAQLPQHNKLPVTFIPGQPCCFGAVAEGRGPGTAGLCWTPRRSECLSCPRASHCCSYRWKGSLYGFPYTSLPWPARWVGLKVATEQSCCRGCFLQRVSLSVPIFKWKIFHAPPQNRDTAELQNITLESGREIYI